MSRPPPAIADLGVLAFLDAPAWFTRRHLLALGAIILPVQLVGIVPTAVGQVLTLRGTMARDPLSMSLGYVLLYGGSVVNLALMAVALTGAAWGVEQALHGRSFTARQALAWALRPARALTGVLTGFLVVMGATLCVFPGLVAAMYLAMVLPVMAAEGLTGGEAIDRSIALARHGPRGRWFTTTGAWALALCCAFVLVNYALGSLATLPAGVIGGWLGFKAAAEGGDAMAAMTALPAWALSLLSLTGAVAYVFSYIYLVAGCALLHRRAREITEGTDIAAALEAAGTTPAATDPLRDDGRPASGAP